MDKKKAKNVKKKESYTSHTIRKPTESERKGKERKEENIDINSEGEDSEISAKNKKSDVEEAVEADKVNSLRSIEHDLQIQVKPTRKKRLIHKYVSHSSDMAISKAVGAQDRKVVSGSSDLAADNEDDATSEAEVTELKFTHKFVSNLIVSGKKLPSINNPSALESKIGDTVLETARPIADSVVDLMGTKGSREDGKAVENLVVHMNTPNSSSNASNSLYSMHSSSEKVKNFNISITSQDMFVATLPRNNCQSKEDDIRDSDYNCKPNHKPIRNPQNVPKTRRKLSIKNEKKVERGELDEIFERLKMFHTLLIWQSPRL